MVKLGWRGQTDHNGEAFPVFSVDVKQIGEKKKARAQAMNDMRRPIITASNKKRAAENRELKARAQTGWR